MPRKMSLCLQIKHVLVIHGVYNRRANGFHWDMPKVPLKNNALLFTLTAFPFLLDHFVRMILSFFGECMKLLAYAFGTNFRSFGS